MGEKTYGAWSAEQSFDAVKSPELKGYTADKAQIDKQLISTARWRLIPEIFLPAS
ncbi:hypothetical protein ABMB44_15165 [Levilactobacillus brevis]